MSHALHYQKRGFTLVEIMIVVAIIALLAAVAVPNFLRARKRSQATRILEDLRVLDYSLERWAMEKNKTRGDAASLEDLRPYIKTNTLLYSSGEDIFGHSYGEVFSVDSNPVVPDASFEQLSDVAPPEFWSPYR